MNATLRHIYLCWTADMSWRTCVVVKQIKSNPIHDEVYTDGSKIDERVGAAAVINRHFQNGETTCRQLSKRLPNNSTIFAAEASAITLALNYYWHMDPVQHDVVIYSDSMSCLQAIFISWNQH